MTDPTPLLVLDVVGLTPVCSTTCPTSRPSGSPAPAPRSAPCCPPSPAPPSPPSSPAPCPPSTASSATAGTSANSATSCCGGSTTAWSPATSCGTPPAAPTPATPSPTSAGGTPWARTPTSPSPPPRLLRRRPQGTRLLHPAARPPRRTHREVRHVPLFHFWGPGADLVSSEWIIDATRHIMSTRRPDLTLCYLPHLDYDLQRFGPDDPRSLKAAADLDAALGPLLDDARAEDAPSSPSPSTASPA